MTDLLMIVNYQAVAATPSSARQFEIEALAYWLIQVVQGGGQLWPEAPQRVGGLGIHKIAQLA